MAIIVSNGDVDMAMNILGNTNITFNDDEEFAYYRQVEAIMRVESEAHISLMMSSGKTPSRKAIREKVVSDLTKRRVKLENLGAVLRARGVLNEHAHQSNLRWIDEKLELCKNRKRGGHPIDENMKTSPNRKRKGGYPRNKFGILAKLAKEQAKRARKKKAIPSVGVGNLMDEPTTTLPVFHIPASEYARPAPAKRPPRVAIQPFDDWTVPEPPRKIAL